MKKIRLSMLMFLIGGMTSLLPVEWKIIVFTPICVWLFMEYDDYQFSNGGLEHE